MTHREVLESAKAVWLAAALRDQRQSPGKGTTGDRYCAVTILVAEFPPALVYLIWRLGFTCPDHSGRAYNVTHFNDIHDWDWLTLARKLGEEPYVLLEGRHEPPPQVPFLLPWGTSPR